MSEKPENLMVAIPCRGEIRAIVFSDLVSALMHGASYWSQRHPGGSFHVETYYRAHVVEARNTAYETARKNEVEWVLWLDDDMAPPFDLLAKLHGTGERFVGGMAYRRTYPHEPCVARYVGDVPEFFDPDPDAAIVKADLTGFACLLTHISVLDAVAESAGGTPFQMRPGLAEDHFFCYHARKLGLRLHIVPGAMVGHAGDVVVTRQHRQAALAERRAENSGDQRPRSQDFPSNPIPPTTSSINEDTQRT
jgi:hypothetical protein